MFFTAHIVNTGHIVNTLHLLPGDFSWVVKDRCVEACLMCALSNMFKIISVLHKESELQAKNTKEEPKVQNTSI